MNQKICTECDDPKDIAEFSKSTIYKGKQYYQSSCKSCAKIYAKEHYRKNKGLQKNIERRKEYYANNKGRWIRNTKEYRESYRAKNKEKIRKYKKEYHIKNKEKKNEESKKHYDFSVSNLTDTYVIKTLTNNNSLTRKEIMKFPELIEAKRLFIKTIRLWKTL